MKKIVPLFTILFVCLTSVHAKTPKSYEMGFDAVSVFEYKQALKKEGEDIPKFPPRTGNALIVESVIEDSRADNAGLQDLDLIRIVNGKLIRSATEADKIFKKITYKDELELGVLRRSDDKWKRITLKLEPMTESEYLKYILIRNHQLDHELKPCVMVRHSDAPFSKYSHKNLQLYYSEVNHQPERLYLRLGIFVRGKDNVGEFVIQTDKTNYKVSVENEIDEQQKALDQTRADAGKLYKAALKKSKEAENNSKVAKAAHLAEFMNFKVDKNRKDEQYEKMRKRVVDSLKNCESLDTVNVEEAKKLLLAIRREKECIEISLEYEKKKLKEARQNKKQALERILVAFGRLSPIRKTIMEKAAELVRQGVEPNEFQIKRLELSGFPAAGLDEIKVDQGWKWYDAPMKKKQKPMIEDIISSNKVTVHFKNAPHSPFELTSAQKKQLKVILKSFEDDGGKVAQ